MPTSLQNLPIELISALVPYLIPQHQRVYPTYTDLSSLYALRLTSRGLYDKTLFDFSRLAFSTIHVDFTLFGLDRFYEISQHEEFRKSVRNIYFAHDFHVRLGLVDEEKKGTAESQGFTGLEEVVNGRLGEVFSEIFQRLDRLEKIVIVTPFAAIYSWFWERGSNNSDNCPDILGPSSYHYERYTLTTTTLYTLLISTLSSPPLQHIQLKTLEITFVGFNSDNRPDMQSALCLCNHALRPHHTALSRLHELRLSFEAEPCCPCPYTPLVSEDALARSLSTMTQLSVLKLTFNFNRMNRSAGLKDFRLQVMRHLCEIHLPHLTAFGLVYAPVEATPLTQFLTRHRSTLKEILLKSVRSYEKGTWATVLTSMLDEGVEGLEHVKLSCLYDGERELKLLVEKNWSSHDLVIGGDIPNMLRSVLETITYMN